MSNIGKGHSTLAPSRLPRMTVKEIWHTVKDYFGDGYISDSVPFCFNMHLCETQRLSPNDNVFLGVHIDEDMMSLFGSLGETVKPPCTCEDMAAVCRYIDDWVEKTTPIDDSYKIFSRKDEASIEETCAYVMRDSFQWWLHWHDGSLAREDHWKLLYIALTTICDDFLIPVEHIVDGTFRFLGHTATDVFAGMLSEGVSAEDVQYMEMCLWRQCFAQYIEKIDPKVRELLLENTHVISQFHVVSANTHGCAAVVLAARGITFEGVRDVAVELASYGCCLSMSLAKETLGILKGEPTETTAGRDRNLLTAELRWTYARVINRLDAHDLAKYLRRFASSGFHFVPFNDRYLERAEGRRRRMLTPQMQALIASYRVGPSGAM